jgi:CheY-like chemotaxis protein
MPGMDGWAVYDRMRAAHGLATIPVVLVSGDDVDVARARSIGVRAVLMYPISPETLFATLDECCDRHRHRGGRSAAGSSDAPHGAAGPRVVRRWTKDLHARSRETCRRSAALVAATREMISRSIELRIISAERSAMVPAALSRPR